MSVRKRRPLPINRRLYSLVMRLAVPFLLLRLLWRSRQHSGYRSQIWQRLGLYGGHRAPRSGERVWIHAVSGGETLAILPLLERLLAERPDLSVLVTSTTPTGAEQVQQKLGGRVAWCWAPFDTPGAAKRFLEHWHPTLGALVETEIWPNLLTHAAARGVPMVLLNARLSERSAAGYARVAGLTQQTLSQLAGIAAQTESDASRLRALGAADEAVIVTGSLKFALDRKALVDQLFEGKQVVAHNPIPIEDTPYFPDIPTYAHDLDKAAALLEAAGWTLPENSDVRVNAAGEPLRIEFNTTAGDKTRELTQQVLRKVGAVGGKRTPDT